MPPPKEIFRPSQSTIRAAKQIYTDQDRLFERQIPRRNANLYKR